MPSKPLIAICRVTMTAAAAIVIGPIVADSQESYGQKNEVTELIEQLGADSYATRVRAMERLQRIGLEAFDELHLAQFHPDIEIEMTARYLVSSLQVSWSKETDPSEVREALHEYGAQDENERTSRIELLAEFPDRKGLPALVRLTRFETSMRLSRQAALAIMQQPMSEDATIRRRNAKQIQEVLGSNDRQASQWLRVYAEDLAGGEYSAEHWRQLIAVQRDQVDTSSNHAATRESVLELVQICATRAAASEQRAAALQLANENIDLIEPTTRHLVDACTWAIDHQLHPFVLELRKHHRRMFNEQPVLLYGAAEAKKVAGDVDQANRLAEAALRIRPLPLTEQARAKMSPRELEDTAQAHHEIGMSLRERGLFHWAEREFRQIIDGLEIDSHPSATVRADLAEMLGELQRHEEVVAVLQPLIERVDNDDKLKQQLNLIFFRYNRFRSEAAYHDALAKIKAGNLDLARPLLRQAFRLYPNNVDILITMYRTDGDDEWNALIDSMLKKAIAQADAMVQNARAQARNRGRVGAIAVGDAMNQYSWLVANTEGDYQKALEYSLKSLEIDPDGAKYDTCARCYFAVGDLDNAILMQKRALKLMPHSPPLVRQLAEFEAAQAE